MAKAIRCPYCKKSLSENSYYRADIRCCWECKKKLTFGEAVMIAREGVTSVKGEMMMSKPLHMPRMPRALIIHYYNYKLRKYWKEQLDVSIPKAKREKALDYLLGRCECISA